MDELVRLGSREHAFFALVLLAGRGLDLLSTWIASPSLALEANPFARRLGWRGGILLSLAAAVVLGLWPLLAVSLATMSVLVAARNLRTAWLSRALGEQAYRAWMSERLRELGRGEFLALLLAETALIALVGVALMAFSRFALAPFAIGLGIVTYAVVVLVYTARAARRRRGEGDGSQTRHEPGL